MKKPETLPDSGCSGELIKDNIPCIDHCPNIPDYQRWRDCDGGAYYRPCWRGSTTPKPVQVTEGRA